MNALVRKSGLGAVSLLLLTLFFTAACGSSSSNGHTSSASASTTAQASSSGKPLHTCFIFNGLVNDENFNQDGYQDMLAFEKDLGSKVTVTYKDNVEPSPASAQVAKGMINSGCKLLIANSAGYNTYFGPLAKANPSVRFEEFSSAYPAANYGSYYLDLSGSSYVAGMMLAAASKSGHIGIVTNFPLPAEFTQINGEQLGAQKINPNAHIQVTFVSSFYNPPSEAQAAKSLINSGVDAIVDGQNDSSVCRVAESSKVPCVAFGLLNGSQVSPTTFLSSYQPNWTPIWLEVARDVMAGKTAPTTIIDGWSQGATFMSPLGPNFSKWVSSADKSKIDAAEHALTNGSLAVMRGPITDQNGKVRIASGQSLPESKSLSVNWFVKGVVGHP